MTTSESINEIAAALAKAQGEIQNVVKDAKNPHFKNDYATLDAVTETVRPVFSKHGLAVVQIPAFRDGMVALEVLITHSSGQWIKGEAGSPIPKADPQGVGSATTYLRRYSLAGIAAIAQTDDDGNTASQTNGQKAEPAKAPEGYAKWIADLDKFAENHTDAELISEIAETGNDQQKAHLRGDGKTLAALRTKAAKNGKKKAAA